MLTALAAAVALGCGARRHRRRRSGRSGCAGQGQSSVLRGAQAGDLEKMEWQPAAVQVGRGAGGSRGVTYSNSGSSGSFSSSGSGSGGSGGRTSKAWGATGSLDAAATAAATAAAAAAVAGAGGGLRLHVGRYELVSSDLSRGGDPAGGSNNLQAAAAADFILAL